MQLSHPRTLAALVSAALVVAVAGIQLSRTATAADPTWTHTVTKVTPSDDTFVTRETPQSTAGSMNRIVVRNATGYHKQAYVKFTVPAGLLNNGGQIESVVLNLTAHDNSRSAVSVQSTKVTSWTEAKTNFANAPAAGATVAKLVQLSGGVSTADLTSAVTAAGTYSFRLTTGSSVSRFASSETGGKRPVRDGDGQAARRDPAAADTHAIRDDSVTEADRDPDYHADHDADPEADRHADHHTDPEADRHADHHTDADADAAGWWEGVVGDVGAGAVLGSAGQ